MNLRPKTKRRLTILLSAAALIVAGGTLLVSAQLHRLQERRAVFRQQAMDAYQHADYRTALTNFKKYLGDSSNADPEALYAYAVSVSEVPRPNLANLLEAKTAFSRYLELQPQDVRAQHRLLELYRQLGYEAEASALSDTLLVENPDDLPALAAKVQGLIDESQFAPALELSQKINQLAPLDLHQQVVTYQLMGRLKVPPVQMLARATQMQSEHPQDPRFEFLCGYVANSFDLPAAKKWLLSAATRPSPDADFTRQLAMVFDRFGMYSQATEILEKAVAEHPADAERIALLLERKWEAGDFDAVISQLQSLNTSSAGSRLLALKALSLYSRNSIIASATQPAPSADRAQANEITDALAQRSTDAVAAAWVALLRSRFSVPPLDARQSLKLCQSAIPVLVDSPPAHYFLGFYFQELGENELAVQAWRQAAMLAPSWATPHLLMAQNLLAAGRLDAANLQATAALERAPQSIEIRATLAAAQYARLGPHPATDVVESLLNDVRGIQTASPNETRTLPAYVALLSAAGHTEDSATALQKALQSKSLPPPATFVELARISAEFHLRQEQNIADLLAKWTPATPDAALAYAQVLAQMGRAQEGLTALTTATAAHSNSPEWQLATAQFRESIHDPAVAQTWVALADNYPESLDIQRAVLASKSAWGSRELIDRTVDRLENLTGEQGIEWRLARARWRLAAPDNVRNNASAVAASMAEVVRIAPTLTDPLILWAAALQKLGDTPGAIARYQTALALSPNNPEITTALAQLSAGKVE